jgi:hypothetical protein
MKMDMALSDWTSGFNHAREKGMREKAIEIARNFKKIGVPVD